ncbi:MAG: glycosyltransferase family 2 protein [Vallitalea sp.]|jgi:glycosyltransferase involved in cell wall biosynthesis|nr:glycosyltransferase family 2 protein [Vallitalea sp.]
MNHDPLVSIITSAYNVEEYIEQCINSVLNQTLSDFEWIILDNGCTDNTKSILEKYAIQDNRIVLLKNKVNNRIKNSDKTKVLTYIDLVYKANGKYITELDSDDYLRNDYLDKMYCVAIKHQADIVACGTTMFLDNNPKQMSSRIPPLLITKNTSEIFNEIANYYGTFRPSWGKLFDRNFYLDNLEYFFDRPCYMVNGGDTLLCLRALQKAKSLVCLDEALHYYRIRQTSGYHSNLFIERYKSYDFIYHESYSLLKEMGALTERNHIFIILVYYNSIMDCIELVSNSTTSSYQDRLIFLQGIVTSEVFISNFGKLNNKSVKKIKTAINNAVEKIENEQDEKSKLHMYEYFIYRQFKANELLLTSANNDSAILFFSSIFDHKNKYKWGKEDANAYVNIIMPKWFINLVKENKININSLFENVDLFIAIINNDVECINSFCNQLKNTEFKIVSSATQNITTNINNLLVVKDTIQDALDNDNIEEAINSLVKIYNDLILDKDILYYRAYLNWLIGDVDVSVYLIASALAFYNQDMRLVKLINRILGD